MNLSEEIALEAVEVLVSLPKNFAHHSPIVHGYALMEGKMEYSIVCHKSRIVRSVKSGLGEDAAPEGEARADQQPTAML